MNFSKTISFMSLGQRGPCTDPSRLMNIYGWMTIINVWMDEWMDG